MRHGMPVSRNVRAPGTARLPTELAPVQKGEVAVLALTPCHKVKRQLKAGQELTETPNSFSSTPVAQSRGRPSPGPPCLCLREDVTLYCCGETQNKQSLPLPWHSWTAPGKGKTQGTLRSWSCSGSRTGPSTHEA